MEQFYSVWDDMLRGLGLSLSGLTGICQQSQYWAVLLWVTGTDLEIINPFLKEDRENETGSSPPLFSADTLQPSGISESSYTAAVALGTGERSGKELLWLLYM